MSPALLSKRLRTLERAGSSLAKSTAAEPNTHLHPSGKELSTVVEALNSWGMRWIGELGEADLDPHLLLWDMRRTVRVDHWPRARTVVAFHLRRRSGQGVALVAGCLWR